MHIPLTGWSAAASASDGAVPGVPVHAQRPGHRLRPHGQERAPSTLPETLDPQL